MNDAEAREMLEGGPGRPAGHVADVPEGMGPFSFGSPWSGLAKCVEEAGEFLKVAGKLMATGGHPAHWQGDLVPRLEEEAGDLIAALSHFTQFSRHIDERRVHSRSSLKVHLFERWHHEGKRNRDEADAVWAGHPEGP